MHNDAIFAFARHVTATDAAAIPPGAVRAAKTFILDILGVAIAGSAGPYVPELLAAAASWGDGDGATVWGQANRLPAPAAALVNAYQAHNSEFDPIHEDAVVHPLASVMAALLADTERRGGMAGQDLMTAAILGVDVSCGIGMASTSKMRFFRPATAGAFGAMAALGRARGTDTETLVSAFGILLGQIGGTMQAHVEGTPYLGMQLGFNTRAALQALDLAELGVPGARHVLEGEFGFLALFEGGHILAPVLDELGTSWRIAELSHKPFPSGRASHGVVDGLLTLQSQHGFAAADVDAVEAQVPPLINQLNGRPIIPEPTANYARLCIPFVGAVALINGTVGIKDFRGDALTDPAVHALARRVAVTVNDIEDPNALLPQRVVVRLKGGAEHVIELDEVYGSPAKPLSRDEHLAKFRINWQSGATPLDPARGEALIEAVDNLEDLVDAREIVRLMTPTS